ncbi:hypothetical protein M426DRAFT_19220 [Hypoxylon sp. CI-4A]|nr:hypothetical protein M426DRAFT_19220 [Hypoxylon sp. CI-4A]
MASNSNQDMDQLVSSAKALKVQMDFLAARIVSNGASPTSNQLDLFDRICTRFESLEVQERSKQDQLTASLEAELQDQKEKTEALEAQYKELQDNVASLGVRFDEADADKHAADQKETEMMLRKQELSEQQKEICEYIPDLKKAMNGLSLATEEVIAHAQESTDKLQGQLNNDVEGGISTIKHLEEMQEEATSKIKTLTDQLSKAQKEKADTENHFGTARWQFDFLAETAQGQVQVAQEREAAAIDAAKKAEASREQAVKNLQSIETKLSGLVSDTNKLTYDEQSRTWKSRAAAAEKELDKYIAERESLLCDKSGRTWKSRAEMAENSSALSKSIVDQASKAALDKFAEAEDSAIQEELQDEIKAMKVTIQSQSTKIEQLETAAKAALEKPAEPEKLAGPSYQDPRKRKRLSDHRTLSKAKPEGLERSPWQIVLSNVASSLQRYHPVLHPDGSCTLDQVLDILLSVVSKKDREEFLEDFYVDAPTDRWYCLRKIAENGYDDSGAEITDANCNWHKQGHYQLVKPNGYLALVPTCLEYWFLRKGYTSN